MRTTFGIDPSEILKISAKSGIGIQEVLEAIIERVPPPQGTREAPLKAFLFDSLCVRLILPLCLTLIGLGSYDRYRGVISLVNVQDGVLKKGARAQSR